MIDEWLTKIFLWTFEHELMTKLFMVTPIYFWVTIGLFVVIGWKNENDDWKTAITVCGVYVLTPIIYWLAFGYIGYLIYG